MPVPVLLILRIPATYNEGITLKRVEDRVDVVPIRSSGIEYDHVIERALKYAKKHGRPVVALLILSSDLYHWGFNDTILPGPAKIRFIAHIREELHRGFMEAVHLIEAKGRECGLSIEIREIETRDPEAAAVEEALKGYDRIFIAKEKKKLFPIFKKTLEQHLRKETSIPVVSCSQGK